MTVARQSPTVLEVVRPFAASEAALSPVSSAIFAESLAVATAGPAPAPN